MKKPALLLFIILIAVTTNFTFGQNQTSNVIASFNGDKISLDKEVQSKTVSFTLKNLNETSRTDFETKAQVYSKNFTIYFPSVRESNNSQVYVLTLLGKTEIKMLNRLFISANINQVEFDGKKMNREDFFKPYMN